jgi:hypothetical protein
MITQLEFNSSTLNPPSGVIDLSAEIAAFENDIGTADGPQRPCAARTYLNHTLVLLLKSVREGKDAQAATLPANLMNYTPAQMEYVRPALQTLLQAYVDKLTPMVQVMCLNPGQYTYEIALTPTHAVRVHLPNPQVRRTYATGG